MTTTVSVFYNYGIVNIPLLTSEISVIKGGFINLQKKSRVKTPEIITVLTYKSIH